MAFKRLAISVVLVVIEYLSYINRVTAGRENVLFHYVQLEIGQGVLLSSTGASTNSPIIKSFRKACLLIHTILQNTIR